MQVGCIGGLGQADIDIKLLSAQAVQCPARIAQVRPERGHSVRFPLQRLQQILNIPNAQTGCAVCLRRQHPQQRQHLPDICAKRRPQLRFCAQRGIHALEMACIACGFHPADAIFQHAAFFVDRVQHIHITDTLHSLLSLLLRHICSQACPIAEPAQKTMPGQPAAFTLRFTFHTRDIRPNDTAQRQNTAACRPCPRPPFPIWIFQNFHLPFNAKKRGAFGSAANCSPLLLCVFCNCVCPPSP